MLGPRCALALQRRGERARHDSHDPILPRASPQYDSDFDVPLSPGGAPSEAKNAELRGKHSATEQRLRRRALWRAARQSQGDARHQFKKLVERNLEAYGYHTRTDSKSLPVVSFTRGRRREEALQSMDFQEFLKSDRGFAHFLKHVQSEFSDENLLFWRVRQRALPPPARGPAA